MRLYLVRHSDAKPAEIDPSRGLTLKGIEEATKVAQFLSKASLAVGEIYHSNKTRAKETASILASHITVQRGAFDTDGLSPNDDPSVWAVRLARLSEDTMLVGHLPHLARLASRLLCDDPKSPVITLPNAGVVCLVRSYEGWSVEWMVTPGILR
jgi:phosphohistidine phosphatase